MNFTYYDFAQVIERDGKIYLDLGQSNTNSELSKFIGKNVEFALKPVKVRRSYRLNNYLWGVVYPTIREWQLEINGESPTINEIHAFCLMEIANFKYTVSDVNGNECIIFNKKSTKLMDNAEFIHYIKSIQLYYAKVNCIIPDPNEGWLD